MTGQNVWNKNWAEWKEDYIPSPFAEKAFKLMKIKDMHDVLDLGCGKGRNSLYFAASTTRWEVRWSISRSYAWCSRRS